MRGRVPEIDERHNPIMRQLSEARPNTVHFKLIELTRDLDPYQIEHIVLDTQATWDGSNGIREKDGCMVWREIPLRVTVPPLKLADVNLDEPISTAPITDPVQITAVMRRRDNERLFYVDHPSNDEPWKTQGSDL
jgi:hypothetical protein